MSRWIYEQMAWEAGAKVVAGMDEAGRGPLAGPVVAACVVLPLGFDEAGVRDSKVMSQRARERAFERIMETALAVGVGMADMREIEEINILQATNRAMRRALLELHNKLPADVLLVDGRPVAELHVGCQAIVRGDTLSVSIAAASIIAKVTRDKLLAAYHLEYPQYGFDRHKGYPTAAHIRALKEYGACPYHRRTFAPVRAVITRDFDSANPSGEAAPWTAK